MIVTVTLNAAIDRTLTVPNFQLGQRHRASAGDENAAKPSAPSIVAITRVLLMLVSYDD